MGLNVCMREEKTLTCRSVVSGHGGLQHPGPCWYSSLLEDAKEAGGGKTGGDEGAGYKWGKALWDIQRSRHRKKTLKKRLRGCRGDTARCQNGRCCIRTLPPRRRGWMFFSPGWCGTKQPPEAPSARGKTRRKGEKTRRAPGREREVSGGKTEKVNRRIENTEGIERRRRWCWASLGWHDGRGTSVKPVRIHDTTSGWRFQSKMCSVWRPT